ncbi:hypothetical protein N7532_005561 [Penicillium argentinense]|uniref:Transcription factor domain-containing protein n=1 Tax=Penicillium argentinense TaxID=1131581 RepID=A0A9W9FEF2_9EURO|nr:uncharacterized protein N7532_005561 [Penicillium argentinense]KAJ5098560.1 hypothetical protein N7532_005561 [Penicillium argentinense]
MLQVSNIGEERHTLQSFVGRMMNHQAELMTWRGELPTHLAAKDTAISEGARAWSDVQWVQRQCFDIELRFNHVMLVLHRPFFARTSFSTPFYSSDMARGVCLGAARATILLSYKVLVQDHNIYDESWSCYYHRVLAATLVVLASTHPSRPREEQMSLFDLCIKSYGIFGSMPSDASTKGFELSKSAVALLSTGPSRSNVNIDAMLDAE